MPITIPSPTLPAESLSEKIFHRKSSVEEEWPNQSIREQRERYACFIVGIIYSINVHILGHSPLPSPPEVYNLFSFAVRRSGFAYWFGQKHIMHIVSSNNWFPDTIAYHVVFLSTPYASIPDFGIYKLIKLAFKVRFGLRVLATVLCESEILKTSCRLWRRKAGGSGLDVPTLVPEFLSNSLIILDADLISPACVVAHSLGDIITGDLADPEVVSSSSPSVGGLLDSLTGSIGMSAISARAKPASTPVATSTTSSTSFVGAILSDSPRNSSRPIDKDLLRTFISASMPFGTPLDLSLSNISVIKANGFSSTDPPPADLKQPAWKPYLYKGKQRIFFTIHEVVHAAMYDRDDILDAISISGQVNCRAELEGLPDVSLPLTGLKSANVEVLSFHFCAQVSEHGVDKKAFMFSPPLGNFVLILYQASCSHNPPVKGFYQLSMVSEDEGAFLFKLRLMEGYKAPLSMELCTVIMPFPRRRIASFDGNPSIGTVAMTEHSVEWKIITSGRSITGKSVEATFPGTIKFFPLSSSKIPALRRMVIGSIVEEDSDVEQDATFNMENTDEHLAKAMNKNLQAAELEEALCWQAYNYAKVNCTVIHGTLGGWGIELRSVTLYSSLLLIAVRKFTVEIVIGRLIRNRCWYCPGSCSETALARMGLTAEPHPSPFQVAWVTKTTLSVTRRCLVPITIGPYTDKIWCDVMPMDVCHVLLGRP
ncbi:hypothetical protein KSP40_PGU008277 [Platanthera guangdongensis]|uniref:MHD domain-containing protein n=1 Tax=Platanthera guangdongensis TaxID=2320717 RepID=A0ABR2M0B8_9ASPA